MDQKGGDAPRLTRLKTPKWQSIDCRFGVFKYKKLSHIHKLKALISTLLCRKAVLVIALLLIPGSVLFSTFNHPTQVSAAPSTYLNFQARLLNASGGLVPDGTYNIEFKLYNVLTDGNVPKDQGFCKYNAGTADPNCEWVETRTGGNTVSVTNGYMSVNLGSVTAFPASIDWSVQQFLVMRIGGTGAPSWDTEMTPRIQLTAVPLAFVANNVASGTTSVASTNSGNISIQSGNATGLTSNSGNINIDTGTATGTTGTISLGATNASSLVLGRSAFTTTNQGSLVVGAASTNNVTISGAGAGQRSTISGNIFGLSVFGGPFGANLYLTNTGVGTVSLGTSYAGQYQTTYVGETGGGTTTLAGGTLLLQSGSTIATTAVGAISVTSSAGAVNLTANTSLTVNGSGTATTIIGNATGGNIQLQAANSATAFQIQNAIGTSVVALDTLSNRLNLAANTLSSGFIDTASSISSSSGGIGQYANLLTASSYLDRAGDWVPSANLTVAGDDASANPAPDGGAFADKLSTTATNQTLSQTYTTAVNGAYTFSLYIKAIGSNQTVQLRLDSTGATPTTGTPSSFTANGTWQRVWVTQTFTGTPSNVTAVILLPASGQTIAAWGAQLVKGSNPLVYTNTLSSYSNNTIDTTYGASINGDIRLTSSDGNVATISAQGGSNNAGNIRFVANGSVGTIAEFRDCCNSIFSVGAGGNASGFRDGITIGNNDSLPYELQIQGYTTPDILRVASGNPFSGVINKIANGSMEGNINGWTARAGATVSVSSDFANFGTQSLKVITGTTVGGGVFYSYPFKPSTTYAVSFYARRDTSTSSSFNFGNASTPYTTGTAGTGGVSTTTLTGSGTTWTSAMVGSLITFSDGSQRYITAQASSTSITLSSAITLGGGTAYEITTVNDCQTGQTINATWNKFTCSFTTGASVSIYSGLDLWQTDTSTDTIYIDGFQMAENGSVADYIAPATLQVDPSAGGTVSLLAGNSGEVGTWQQNTSLPGGRQNGASVTANGYIYEFGGYDVNSSTTTTSYYAKLNADGSTGAWSTTTALPNVSYGHRAVTANGYIYIIGGHDGITTNYSTVYYARVNTDGTLGAWTTNANAMPFAGREFSSVVNNGYVYILGGSDGAVRAQTYSAKLNANGSTGAWAAQNALPLAIRETSSVVANSFVYVIGGITATAQTTVYYATLSNTGVIGSWQTSVSPLPSARKDTISGVSNGYVYTVSGIDGSGSTTSTVYYAKLNADGSTSAWTTAANALPVASGKQTSAISNGYFYAIGGVNATNATATVYYTRLGGVLQVGGNLDLVGLQGQTLSGTGDSSNGSVGGSITAGNGTFVGNLQVRGSANLSQSLSVGGNLNVQGDTNYFAGSLQVGGANNASQLVVKANVIQGNTPLISAVDSTAGQLFELRAPDVSSIAIGANAGYNLATNQASTFLGHAAGTATYGVNNTAVGYGALSATGAGADNVAMGAYSIDNFAAGDRNTAIGSQTLRNTTGANNTVLGFHAGNAVVGGSNNLLLGYQAGDAITSGSNNIIIGYNLGAASNTGSNQLNIAGLLQSTDYTTGNLTVGTVDTIGQLFVLDTKTGSGDPTGVNGGMYYNSNAGKFRCYQAGAWADCIGAGGSGSGVTTVGGFNGGTANANGATISGTTIYLQSASTSFAGLVDTTTQSFIGNKTFTGSTTLIKNASDSTSAFSVQKAGSTNNVLQVDTTNNTTILRAGTDTAVLGSEQVTSQNFTTANWTTCNGGAGGWSGTSTTTTHNTGNVTTCSAANANFTVTAGTTYQITFTVAGNSTLSNTVTPSIGGGAGPALGANTVHTVVLTAFSTTNLTFTPSTNFNGAISSVSVKAFTTIIKPVLSINDASNGVNLEVRTTPNGSSVLIGNNAGAFVTGGGNNTALGNTALGSLVNAYNDTAIGFHALQSETNGGDNTAIGYQALQNNTTGGANTAVGSNALANNTTGTYNNGFGLNILQNNTTGSSNNAFGYHALQANITGSDNNAFGVTALTAVTSGINNTGFGESTLDQTTTGGSNSALGNTAGHGNITGLSNTYLGDRAGNTDYGFSTLGGLSQTTAVGYLAQVLQSNTIALGLSSDNTLKVGIGNPASLNFFSAGAYTNTSGNACLASTGTSCSGVSGNQVFWSGGSFTAAMVGQQLVFADGTSGTITAYTSATRVTLSVSAAMSSAINFRTYYAGLQVTNAGNVGIGVANPTGATLSVGNNVNQSQLVVQAAATQSSANPLIYVQDSTSSELFRLTAPDQNSIFLGYQAGQAVGTSANSVGIGWRSLYNASNTGSNNAAVGINTLSSNTSGANNTAIGSNALQSNTNASNNTGLGMNAFFNLASGGANTAVGYQAGNNLISGANNTAVGYNALNGAASSSTSNSVAVGFNAGQATTSGNNNIFLGYQAGANVTSGSNNLIVGYNLNAVSATGSNQLNIGSVLQGDTSLGSAFFQNITNSVNALQVKNAAGDQILTIDTLNNQVNINGQLEVAGEVSSPFGGIGYGGNGIWDSEDFTTGNWASSSLTPTTGGNVDPEGLSNASSLVTSATNATLIGTYANAGAAGTYTFSIWLKGAVAGSAFSLAINNTGGSTVSTPTNYTTTTGWRRYTTTYVFTGSPTVFNPKITISASGITVYAWGAQMQNGTVAGVYTGTTRSNMGFNGGNPFTGAVIDGRLSIDNSGCLFFGNGDQNGSMNICSGSIQAANANNLDIYANSTFFHINGGGATGFTIAPTAFVSAGAGTLLQGAIPGAITQSGAKVGLSLDFSTNNTVPNNVNGNQTGITLKVKDGGATATAIGLSITGTADRGVDLSGVTVSAGGVALLLPGGNSVVNGIQFGTDANLVTLYRSANDVLKTDDSLTVGTDLIVSGNTTHTGTTTFTGTATANGSLVAANGLTVTSGSETLGTSSQAGSLVLSDGTSNTVTLTSSGIGTNYSLTLPTTAGTTNQCLQTDTVTASQLIFANCTAGTGSGVTSLGAIDGQASNGNGGAIVGTIFYQQSATATNGGIVNASTQTFGGAKTFSAAVTLSGASSSLIFSGVTTAITTGTNQTLTIAPNGSGNIQLGAIDGTGTQLVLDEKNTTGDPTGINGGMYYNSNVGKFRCFQGGTGVTGGAWKDCLSSPTNASTADQAIPASTAAYLTNSNIAIPAGGIKAGSTFNYRITMTKTAAGTVANTFDVRFGTNGTTTDTSRCSFAMGTETAVVDTAVIELTVTVRSVGATATIACNYRMSHNLAATGFDNALITKTANLTSATFDDTVANSIVGVSYTTGALYSITVQQVQATTTNL
jgi:hypothetical protein